MIGGLTLSRRVRSDKVFGRAKGGDGMTSPRLGRGHAGDHGKLVERVRATFFPESYRHLWSRPFRPH